MYTKSSLVILLLSVMKITFFYKVGAVAEPTGAYNKEIIITDARKFKYSNNTNTKMDGSDNIVNLTALNQSPVHEEYMLEALREKFRKDVGNHLQKEILQELHEAKRNHLKNFEKCRQVLEQCESVLIKLNSSRRRLDDRALVFSAQANNEVRLLKRQCEDVEKEIIAGREAINSLLKPSNKDGI